MISYNSKKLWCKKINFYHLSFFKFLKFIYFERQERINMSGREAEKSGERESQAGSTLLLWTLEAGLKLTNDEIMTSVYTKSQMLNWLSHPGAPNFYHLSYSLSAK